MATGACSHQKLPDCTTPRICTMGVFSHYEKSHENELDIVLLPTCLGT